MAVRFPPGPSACFELGAERLHVEHVGAVAEGLDLVVVEDNRQVVDVVLRREPHCLPRRTLVDVAVAHEAEDAMRFASGLGSQRHADRDGQTVAQRPGGELDAGHVVTDVAHQFPLVAVIALEPLLGEETHLGQHGIDPSPAVPLAQNEAVAIRLVGPEGVHVQDACVENGEDIGHRQHAADVAASASVGHAQAVLADCSGQVLAFLDPFGVSSHVLSSPCSDAVRPVFPCRASGRDVPALLHDAAEALRVERDAQDCAAVADLGFETAVVPGVAVGRAFLVLYAERRSAPCLIACVVERPGSLVFGRESVRHDSDFQGRDARLGRSRHEAVGILSLDSQGVRHPALHTFAP